MDLRSGGRWEGEPGEMQGKDPENLIMCSKRPQSSGKDPNNKHKYCKLIGREQPPPPSPGTFLLSYQLYGETKIIYVFLGVQIVVNFCLVR